MSRDMNQTRSDKFEKRRKSTKAITIGIIAASILVIILLGIWVFGGSGGEEQNADENENSSSDEDSDFLITEPDEEEEENNNSTDNEENGQDEQNNDNNEQENENEQNEDIEQNNNVETESVEPSDDNVSDAYTGNWDPIGTEQEGPHTTTYDDGSQDRIEIKEATSMVTGIDADNMVEWLVENGGDQKVIATVSDKDETQTFRVYLQWVDGEGWQPTKVEELIENDKK